MTSQIAPTSTNTKTIPHKFEKPLKKFHGRVVAAFKARLSKTAPIWDLAKRVALIVLSPFAYLALGLVALTGYALRVKRTPDTDDGDGLLIIGSKGTFSNFKENMVTHSMEALRKGSLKVSEIASLMVVAKLHVDGKDYVQAKVIHNPADLEQELSQVFGEGVTQNKFSTARADTVFAIKDNSNTFYSTGFNVNKSTRSFGGSLFGSKNYKGWEIDNINATLKKVLYDRYLKGIDEKYCPKIGPDGEFIAPS